MDWGDHSKACHCNGRLLEISYCCIRKLGKQNECKEHQLTTTGRCFWISCWLDQCPPTHLWYHIFFASELTACQKPVERKCKAFSWNKGNYEQQSRNSTIFRIMNFDCIWGTQWKLIHNMAFQLLWKVLIPIVHVPLVYFIPKTKSHSLKTGP